LGATRARLVNKRDPLGFMGWAPGTQGAVRGDFLVADAVRRNRSHVANSLFRPRIREFFSGHGERQICPTRKTDELSVL
jgi:hypothetical protein